MQNFRWLIALGTLALVPSLTSVSQGAVSLVDDFESYPLNVSIDGQGAWEAQRNGANRADHFYSNVVTRDGDKALRFINRDTTNEVDVVYTAMELPNPIQQGTIYLRWMRSSEGFTNFDDDGFGGQVFPGSAPTAPIVGDNVFAVNGRLPGFDPDEDGFSTFDGGQDANNFSQQSALVQLWGNDSGSGGQQFRARNGGGYQDVDVDTQLGTPGTNLVFDQWYEMWIQVDHTANQQSRYYLAEDGGTPQVVLNGSGGEWWAHRDTSYSAATNIKMFASVPFPFPESEDMVETRVYIDTVGVDEASWSTNSLSDGAALAGDYNGNGTVDAADYTVWRDGNSPDSSINGYNAWVANFGSTSSNSESTSVPEPSSLLLGAVALMTLVAPRHRQEKQG